MTFYNFLFFLFFLLAGCQDKDSPDPVEQVVEVSFREPTLTPIVPGLIDETSGMADSRSTANALWIHEDSGNPAEITLISYAGAVLKKIPVKNSVNRDWEDMALVHDGSSGKNIMYLADIGDNNMQYDTYDIYRFDEPGANDIEINNVEKITFRYADGPHDAEAILVDEMSKDIFIITKRDTKSGIYRLAYPQNLTAINTAVLEGSLDYSGVTSAAISADGKEIVVKTYTHINYYDRKENELLPVSLKRKSQIIPYLMEAQGEAICWKKDNKGFFTLSERGLLPAIDLRYYEKN